MRGLHTLGDSQLSLQSRPGNGINEARTGSKASRKSRAETSHEVTRGLTLVGLSGELRDACQGEVCRWR